MNIIKYEKNKIIHSFSWSIYNCSLAVKRLDKTAIHYNESPIPLDIIWFFDAEDLSPGFDKEIQLHLHDTVYSGKICCKYRHPLRVNLGIRYHILWSSSLKEFVETAFNSPKDGTPAISFRKTNEENVYECSFCSVMDDDTLVEIPLRNLPVNILGITESYGNDYMNCTDNDSLDEDVEIEPVNNPTSTVDISSNSEKIVVERLFKFIETQPRYKPDDIADLSIKDGIFFLLDNVEKYNNHDRIVYVGVNHKLGNLKTLLQTTLFGNKNESVLRKYIGTAFLLKKRNPYWRIWLKDTSNAYALRKVGTFHNPKKEILIEESVSMYIRYNFSVVCISNLSKSRINLQTKIINSLKSVYSYDQLSEKWLGKSAHDDRITESGLWELGSLDIESQLSSAELDEIIFTSDKSPNADVIPEKRGAIEQSSNDIDDIEYSDECQWTIVNKKCAIMKIDSGTANDGRTVLSNKMLRFFKIDAHSSSQLRGISVIHSDIEYDCIIRRLSRRSADETPLYIIKWNNSLNEIIKIYFFSGVKTHIAFSKSERKSTYRLEIIKNPDDYIKNLLNSKQNINEPSISEDKIPPENETITSTKEDLSPLHKRRERIIKFLFDKEDTKVRKTLISHYQYGFNINSFIEIMRFKNFYYADFGVEYAGDDTRLKSEIQASGILFEGKIYCVSLEAIRNLQRIIDDAEYVGIGLIYYERLYSKNRDWLFDGLIMSPEMLKDILSRIYSTFLFGQNYFLLSPHKINEKEAISNEILRIWGNQQLRTEEELSDLLPYVSEDKIKSGLSTQNLFVLNSRYTYARRDLFRITDEEISALRDAALSLCAEKASVTFDELPLENITAENFELSQTALYDMIFSYLSDDFERTKSVITFKGDTHGTKDSIIEFCKCHESCTLSDLTEVLLQISGKVDNQAIYSMIEAANSVMVRVTADDFVSDEMVNFDTQNIDAALDVLVPNEICGVKEITTFSLFPSCGFEWNLFILESYCRRFSDKYRYVSVRANTQNQGAIIKVGNTIDYHQIMTSAVANSSVELNEDAVFDYLVDAGFLSRKRYNRIDELLNAARELR